jgi:methylamine dehydrogenase accessory protein MauD
MTDALLISNILVWIALIALGVAVVALARQIGVLHERIRPVGALSLGKTIGAGEPAPTFHLPSLTGGAVSIDGVAPDGRTTLLFFVSATCPVCTSLLPMLKAIAANQAQTLRLVFASDGAEAEHREFIRRHQLAAFPYLLSTEVGMAYRISKLPYAVLISPSGVIVTHGLVNTREHLESLFEAQALGVASQQDYAGAGSRVAA